MIPRHPLIFKAASVCAIIFLVVILLFNRESHVIITRSNDVTLFADTGTEPITVTYEESVLKVTNITTTAEAEVNESEEGHLSTTTTTDAPATTTRHEIIVRADSFDYSITQEKCSNTTYLMIYVHSDPENTERRRVIRKTWASKDILKRHKAKLIFVMGQVKNRDTQAALENENEVFGDMIQGNFTDTYRNLTYKALAGLRWVTENCPDVVYVLKTDDDIIVDINRVVRLMHTFLEKKFGKEKLLGGHVWQHMDVDRNKTSKWYTSPDEFPKDFFLQYCSGSAYIMTSDVVKLFYERSLSTPFFWVDDYYVTGMLADRANITVKSMNDRYFLKNTADIMGALANDTKTRLIYIHSPNTNVSTQVWQRFLDRW